MSTFKAVARPSTGPVHAALLAGPATLRHAGRVVQHLAVGLIDEPLGLTLIAPEAADASALPCPPVNVLRYPLPAPWRLHSRVVEPLAQELIDSGVEVLHALDPSIHGLTRALSAAADLPYLVSVWGLPSLRHLAPAGAQCRAVLAVSTPMRQALVDSHVVGEDLIHIIRPGVHQSPRRGQEDQSSRSRSIIAAGRFEPYGPFETVIRAFGDLRQRGYDCVLFLLGEGPAEHRLRQMAHQMGLMHQVTFIDSVPPAQLSGILAATDIFLYPRSTREFELELLEAMAAGVPALVGECCVGDFAQEGITSLSYRPNDSSDLAAKLRTLLDDAPSAQALADRARKYLRENHSPARMVAATADLYRKFALSERTLKLA
jgi:glycosyltransferase involved in cell wall biosynthesis